MSQHLVDVSRCQVCGSKSSALLFAEDPYEIKRCTDCSLVYVSPRWSDDRIHQVYDAKYWRSDSPKTKGYADYAQEADLYLKTFRRRRRLVDRYVPPTGRVLDIGCAAGYFLRVMHDAGHDVRGIEPSSAIAEEAIRHLGKDRIHVGTLDGLRQGGGRPGFEPHSFDLVTMWDVIEHIPDPQALLRQAAHLLKPDGHLILETQNVDSHVASLLGSRWHHYKHEEHLYHVNRRTLPHLLDQGGYRPIRITSSYGGKYVSFGFIAERVGRLSRIASLLSKPLLMLKRVNLYLNLRDELVVVAKPLSPVPSSVDINCMTATSRI